MPIPIISPEQMKKEPPKGAKSTMRIISGAEVTTRVKKIPKMVRAVIPTGDTCCTNFCAIINGRIEHIESELEDRKEKLERATKGGLIEAKEVTRKVPLKEKGRIVKGKFEEKKATVESRLAISYSLHRQSLKGQVRALTNKVLSLRDVRHEMAEKGYCKCFEEIGLPEIEEVEEIEDEKEIED